MSKFIINFDELESTGVLRLVIDIQKEVVLEFLLELQQPLPKSIELLSGKFECYAHRGVDRIFIDLFGFPYELVQPFFEVCFTADCFQCFMWI